MSKYGARRTKVDGITFDSKREAEYYSELKLLKRAGQIKDFELQPEFVIIPPHPHKVTGKKVRGMIYKADFKVIYPDDREEYIDVKGVRTEVYKIKKKFVEWKYGIEIKEIS